MTCAVRENILPKGGVVRVNGVAIPRDAIAREIQHHPAPTPTEAWKAAAQALVVRELLLQEARRLDIAAEPLVDASGRYETAEEAFIRALIAREVTTPEPDEDSCRRFYERNRDRFRSADIFEAAHILVAADGRNQTTYDQAREKTESIAADLRQDPARLEEIARTHSDCPSAAQNGNLGQIARGQTTPEFERELQRLAPGEISGPVATRYGFHIIRLDRRVDGRLLPFEAVADRIADYLKERVERTATAQYVARLVSRAAIEGLTMADADALRVH